MTLLLSEAKMYMPNYNQPARQVILDLINNANSNNDTLLTLDMVSFSIPIANNAYGHNTRLHLTPTETANYSGFANVYYTRLNLADVPGTRMKTFDVTIEKTMSDLLPKINARYGIQLTPDDIDDTPIPIFSTTVDVDLVTTYQCLLFIGRVTLTLRAPAQH